MRVPRPPGCLVAGAAILVVLSIGFFATHERVREEITTGLQGRARRDPYLALGRFLAESGIPFDERPGGLSSLPPDGHILLLFSPRESFPSAQVDRVLSWVERGGQLVVSPSSGSEDDELLTRILISKKPVQASDAAPQAKGSADPPSLVLDIWGEEMEVQSRARSRLLDGRKDCDIASPGPDAAFLLSFPLGSGRVTVVANPGIFSNTSIGKAGHARLLLRLLSGPQEDEGDGDLSPRSAWLVRRDEAPSFLSVLNRRAGPALWSLALLVAVVLLHSGRRYGPVRETPRSSRRSLLEHIDAGGEYLYRRGLVAVLVKATREALLRRLAVLEPATVAAGPRDCVRRLSILAGLSPARVDRVLFGDIPEKPEELAGLFRSLESLRRCL